MTDRWKRPEPQSIAVAYERLFHSSTPLSKLKDAAFGGRLLSREPNQSGVVGRSMAWKLFLIPSAPLTPPADQTYAKPPLEACRSLRKDYVALLLEKMRAPDGSYEEGFSVPGVNELPRASDRANANLERDNPLSLHDDNPWKDWFTAVDLRKTIRQDVERTFPDIDYFRDTDIQAQLTNILYIHSVVHGDIGYRQGMHELLAPLYYALDYDAIESDTCLDPELSEFCSRTWVAADAWALFGIIMQGVGSWYEWREPLPPVLPSPLRSQFRHGAPEGQVDLQPYVAPIVLACQRLQSEMLKASDPMLWQGLQKSGIEPQIYGIRWLRLLFTREFSLPDAMILWDGIFACDQTFELVPWICVAMLIRIRNRLLSSDYSGQLTSLLRYPPPPSSVDPSSPHQAVLLLRQAFALYTTPNPSTGASIAIENRNLLNIPLDVPELEAPPVRRQIRPQQSPMRRRASMDLLSSTAGKEGPNRNRPTQQSQQLGLPELFARGLLEKSESLGINKTVMNAVAELRKNIPDLAGQLMRTPGSSTATYSSFPLVDERPAEERPPWEPRTRFEMEKEITEMRGLQRRLGDAIGLAVDSLLQDEGGDRDEDSLKKIRERKREAIESLAHVRDILKGISTDIDEERLFGEEEHRRRIQRRREEENSAQRASGSASPPLRPPEPVVAARTSGEHRKEQSLPSSLPSHPMTTIPRSPLVTMPPQEPTSFRSVGRIATLPRSGTGPLLSPVSSADSPSSLQAPWNYTRSQFSAPTFTSTELPRPPPRSSANIRPDGSSTHVFHTRQDKSSADQAPRQRKVSTDPLGVLPH